MNVDITLPDGSVRNYESPVTGYQIAEMINNQPQPSNSKSNIVMNLINTKNYQNLCILVYLLL